MSDRAKSCDGWMGAGLHWSFRSPCALLQQVMPVGKMKEGECWIETGNLNG